MQVDPSSFKDVRIQNEGNVDRNFIVNEATELYKECVQIAKDAKVDTVRIISGKGEPKKQDLDFLDKLYEKKRSEHKQLFDTYPTVVRHMIQELQYSRNAFNDYLLGLEKNPWMNDSQRMDSYTDYGVLLYKKLNKKSHPSKTQIELFRKDYRDRLQSEHERFMQNVEEHQKQIEKEANKYAESTKKDLVAIFKKQLAESDKKEVNNTPVFIDGEDSSETEREKAEKLVALGILSPDVLNNL